METVQQNRPEISDHECAVPPADERSLCDRLKTTRLAVELGGNYIVWSVFCCSIKNLKMCKSGMLTADNMSDPEIACTHLQNLIIQNNLVEAEVDLYLSIPDALLRCHYIPAVPKNELEQVVVWESNKIFPFTFNQAFYDWKIAETLEWGGSKKYEIQAAAVPQDRIRPIFDLLHKNALKIKRITYTSLAWEEYLRHCHKGNKGTESGNIALARLVGNDLTILFFHKHFLEFMRKNNLESGSLGGGFEESLRFLNEDSTSTVDNNLAINNIKLEDIARDINDSLDYYYGQFSQRNIDKVLIAFPRQIQDQSVAKLRDLLGVEVQSAYDSGVTGQFDSEVPVNLLMPSGYVSRYKSESLNLLPEYYHKKLAEKKRLRISFFAAALVVILIAGISFFQQWQINTNINTTKNLKANLEKLKTSQAYDKIQSLTALEQNLIAQVRTIENHSGRPAEFMKALSNLTPGDIRILNINTFMDKSTVPALCRISLNGFVKADAGFPEVLLADYIKTLKQVEFVNSVQLKNDNIVLQSEGRRLKFNLELEIN